MFEEFFKIEKITPNPDLKKKMEELFNLYSYCEGEVARIKVILEKTQDKHNEIIEQENKYNELLSKVQENEEKLKQQGLEIENRKQVLIDLNNELKRKDDLNKIKEDLTLEIESLLKEKDEIVAFNRQNKIEKEDLKLNVIKRRPGSFGPEGLVEKDEECEEDSP